MNTHALDQAEMNSESIRLCLARILSSKRFKSCPRITRLLSFIVEAKLKGAHQLKSYTLGVEVFDRSKSHDPQTDSIVRTSTVRLRKMLDEYYAEEGRDDPIRILLNKGNYLPTFANASDLCDRLQENRHRILLIIDRLELIGTSSEWDYLSVGLSEELTASLSSYDDENFIAILAPEKINLPSTLPDIQENPKLISFILCGTIRVCHDEMRCNFKLLDGKSSVVHWCENFTSRITPESLFEIQEDVSRQVACKILDPHGIIYRSFKRKPAKLLGTYLALFRYNEYQECFTPELHLQARDCLEIMVRAEPNYSDAWAALANVYLGEALFGFNPTASRSKLIEKIVQTAQKAVAIEPRSVMANYILSMALFYSKDKPQFQVMAEQSLKLAPFRPDNIAVVGMHLILAGKFEQGLALMQKAMTLNPFHPSWHYLGVALYHMHHRNYVEALNTLSRFSSLDFFPFQINLAVIHSHLGNQAEALKSLERMFKLWPAAEDDLKGILDFWFPFEDFAEIFVEGLDRLRF